MATAENRLTEWLRDAQAMEKQAEAMLDALAEGIEHYPDVKAQIERHLQEAREQVSALQGYVEQFGEGAQTWKESARQCAVMGQGLSGVFLGGKFVKRAITEISCYNILIAAAASLGDDETRAVCEGILCQEEAMLNWLKNYLASATAQYLDPEETPDGETSTLSEP
jgi:ferritin-like metal-binding protein YciE